ncbi:hypothetical protein Anapl_12340 [Anas platyrhynchos]|uniref:Uncharacterized protein n=1 Tax=Anas platyrhynchos TaxID=8839 RepID=R0LVT5_ANAPL|nr:hypothetical protein Anapl_12340 [Anas platyrhynchos]
MQCHALDYGAARENTTCRAVSDVSITQQNPFRRKSEELPEQNWSNGDVGRRQEHQTDRRGEQKCACSPEHSAGPSNGRKPEGSVRAMHENQTDCGMGLGTRKWIHLFQNRAGTTVACLCALPFESTNSITGVPGEPPTHCLGPIASISLEPPNIMDIPQAYLQDVLPISSSCRFSWVIYDRCCCSLSHKKYVSIQEREKEGDNGSKKFSEAIHDPPGLNIAIYPSGGPALKVTDSALAPSLVTFWGGWHSFHQRSISDNIRSFCNVASCPAEPIQDLDFYIQSCDAMPLQSSYGQCAKRKCILNSSWKKNSYMWSTGSNMFKPPAASDSGHKSSYQSYQLLNTECFEVIDWIQADLQRTEASKVIKVMSSKLMDTNP